MTQWSGDGTPEGTRGLDWLGMRGLGIRWGMRGLGGYRCHRLGGPLHTPTPEQSGIRALLDGGGKDDVLK